MTDGNEPKAPAAIAASDLAGWVIRDLVAIYPATMTVLGPMGIDLRCGGAHPLVEALDLHGLERNHVLAQVARAIAASRRDE